MKKNTPLIVFTGLAVVAAGVLGAVLTGNYPGADAPQPVAEAPAAPAEPAPAEPAQPAPQPAAQAETPSAPAQEAAATPPAATQTEAAQAPAEQPAAEPEVASAPAQDQQPAASQQDAQATPPAAPAEDPDVPSFDTVNVMPTGEAVVAGHGKPGTEVVLKFAGVEVSRATAGDDGSFAMVPDKPLPVGAGELTLEATVGGKVLTSKDQIAVVVNRDKKPALVAKVDATAPTKIVQAPVAAAGEPAKEVQLSAVDYDADGNIIFQGRVTPGGTVRFYVDNQLAGDVTSDDAGNWMFKGTTPIAPGTHMLRADEIDATGKVISRAELPFLREEAGKVVAAAEAGAAAQSETPAATTAEAAEQPDQVQQKSAETGQPAAASAEEPAASPVVVASAPTLPSRIVIQPGNNLWRISREVYGKGKMFTVIWEANKDQIKNPNRIYPGQILSAPKS